MSAAHTTRRLARATARVTARRARERAGIILGTRMPVTGRCHMRVREALWCWVLWVADPQERRFTAYVLDRAELRNVSRR